MNRAGTHDCLRRRACLRAAFIASLLAAIIARPASSETSNDYQCSRGDDVRRIEIRFEDDTGQLPCRVIYRPETENAAVGTVSWRGITALDQCEAQAGQVVDRLKAEGWNCAFVNHLLEPQTLDIEQATLVEQAKLVEDAAEEIDAATTPQAPDDQPIAKEAAQPGLLVENPDLDAPLPALAKLLNEDLGKLAITLDGNLEAKIVAYSDLNADDIDDALVLLTYASPQPAYRQFLAAYLYDGEAYQLTATRPISSSSSDTQNARIDGVDQGIIQVTLQAFEPGDQSCCPSGVREISLALRDLDLVEIDERALTR